MGRYKFTIGEKVTVIENKRFEGDDSQQNYLGKKGVIFELPDSDSIYVVKFDDGEKIGCHIHELKSVEYKFDINKTLDNLKLLEKRHENYK